MSVLTLDEAASDARCCTTELGNKPWQKKAAAPPQGKSTFDTGLYRVHHAKEQGETVDHAIETVRRLRAQLEQYRRGLTRLADTPFVSTGVTPLDDLLPHGGLPCGAIVEILTGAKSIGSMTLAMRIAAQDKRHTSNNSRNIIFVDTNNDFYPPAATQYGIPIDRIVVVQPRRPKDAFWAVDQSLRCPAVAVVVAPLHRLDPRESRRLQLAAQSGGSIGLLLQSVYQNRKSFAALRLLLEHSAHAFTDNRPKAARRRTNARCRITLLSVRDGIAGQSIEVDLHHETIHESSHAVPVDRPLARTGS